MVQMESSRASDEITLGPSSKLSLRRKTETETSSGVISGHLSYEGHRASIPPFYG